MTDIKLMVAVNDGEIFTLTVPQEMWIEKNDEAHWNIHFLINAAMRRAAQEAMEEYDYKRWFNGPWMEDEDSWLEDDGWQDEKYKEELDDCDYEEEDEYGEIA